MNYGRFGAVGDLAPQLAGMFGRLLGCGKRCTPALFNVSEGLDCLLHSSGCGKISTPV